MIASYVCMCICIAIGEFLRYKIFEDAVFNFYEKFLRMPIQCIRYLLVV